MFVDTFIPISAVAIMGDELATEAVTKTIEAGFFSAQISHENHDAVINSGIEQSGAPQ